MEAIAMILAIFSILFFIAAVAGLIKPAWVKQASRGKGFLIYFGGSFLLAIGAGMMAPESGDQEGGKSAEPQAQAHSYRVFKAEDFNFTPVGQRRSLRWHIISPNAKLFADRAITVIQAAKELMQEAQGATEADEARIWLEVHEDLTGTGRVLASARYNPDGKGNSRMVWEVESSDIELSEQQIQVLLIWEQHAEEFRDESGVLDEEGLKNYIAKKLTLQDVRLAFWIKKEFPFDEQKYEVVGTKSTDSIASPW